jgi:hypothetical protein
MPYPFEKITLSPIMAITAPPGLLGKNFDEKNASSGFVSGTKILDFTGSEVVSRVGWFEHADSKHAHVKPIQTEKRILLFLIYWG